MKKTVFIICLISALALTAGCGRNTDAADALPEEQSPAEESSKELTPEPKEEPEPETEPDKEEEPQLVLDADALAQKEIALGQRSVSTNQEVCDLVAFLLEYSQALTQEELGRIGQADGNGDPNILMIFQWYRNRGLDTMRLEVLETESLGSRSNYPDNGTMESGEDFYLKVNVLDAGDCNVEPGEQEWVLQTFYQVYDVAGLMPEALITYEEYLLRMGFENYEDEIALVKQWLIFGTREPFESIADVPSEDLVQYVVYTAATKSDQEFTQAELDEHASRLLGIEHLEPGDSHLYDPDTGLYTAYGYGPPNPSDSFCRAAEDADGVHLDYVSAELAMRYTVKDGRVVRAVDISGEMEGDGFGEIRAQITVN